MPNALTMLKSDHASIKRLLRELAQTTDKSTKQREQLCAELERTIKIHAQVEEEVFYPAYKAATDRTPSEELFYEAAEEHHIVDMVLPALKAANPKSHEFGAKAKVLRDLVEHHIKMEESQMFAQALQLFDEDQLRELGSLMQTRRDLVEAMWNNPLLRPMKKLQSAAHKLLPTKVKTAKAAAIQTGFEAAEDRG